LRRYVMSLVRENSAILLHEVGIGSAGSSAHQNYADPIAQPKVHAALEAYALVLAHLDI